MKKVLIVDKNKESRSYLRSLVEEYAHDKHKRYAIHETDSGTEAVMICDHEPFDLIFMDVEINEIESAEATRLIREKNAKAMIIVTSDSQDNDVRTQILQSGAEDYIRKPIEPNLFATRLENYMALVKSRRLHLSIHEGHNLYGDETFGRTVFYYIKEYDVLAEFWEYFLLESQETRTLTDACRRCNVGKSILNSHQASPHLSDSVRAIYDIALLSLNVGLMPHIWIEESDKKIYFTIEGLSQVNPNHIYTVLNKIPDQHSYKYENCKVTIVAPKEKIELCKSEEAPLSVSYTETPITKPSSPLLEETPIAAAFTPSPEAIIENEIYDYMDEEDLDDIKDNLSRLNTLLLMVGSGNIRYEEVEEIAYYLERIGKTASIYSESYSIARALSDLAYTIKQNLDIFIEKSSSLGMFCKTFGLDLTNWLQMTFYDGAPSVNFMDDTIVSNAQMVGTMLTAQESPAQSMDMDDIFDF